MSLSGNLRCIHFPVSRVIGGQQDPGRCHEDLYCLDTFRLRPAGDCRTGSSPGLFGSDAKSGGATGHSDRRVKRLSGQRNRAARRAGGRAGLLCDRPCGQKAKFRLAQAPGTHNPCSPRHGCAGGPGGLPIAAAGHNGYSRFAGYRAGADVRHALRGSGCCALCFGQLADRRAGRRKRVLRDRILSVGTGISRFGSGYRRVAGAFRPAGYAASRGSETTPNLGRIAGTSSMIVRTGAAPVRYTAIDRRVQFLCAALSCAQSKGQSHDQV